MRHTTREHLLTDLVEQIDMAMALRRQGRHQDAASVMESAYATAHSLDVRD
jgi:hypothetical protein